MAMKSQVQEFIEFMDRTGRGITGLAIKILGPYFLLMFAARWLYIVNGIDFDPSDELEKKALAYFQNKKKRKEE
jgi:hypothetical protein